MDIWNRRKEERLVYMVKKRAPLYNVSERIHSAKVKTGLWREIAEDLACAEKAVKKKWDVLRSQYVRYKRWAPWRKGRQRTSRMTWIMRKLQFLEAHIRWNDLQEDEDTINVKSSSYPEAPHTRQNPGLHHSTRNCSPPVLFWSQIKEDKLVSMIEERTALYDVSKIAYTDKVLKSLLWGEIEEALGCSEKEIKKKWEILRTQYTRYKRQLSSGSGDDQRTPRQTWIMERLQFLERHIRKPDLQLNITTHEGQDTILLSSSKIAPLQPQQNSGPSQSTPVLSNSTPPVTVFWNEEKEKKLISMIEERTTLYDVLDRAYCDKVLKPLLWREIEQAIGCSEKDIKMKWESLRTQYYRYKRLADSSGDQRTPRQTWMLDRLQFLEPCTRKMDSQSNLKSQEGEATIKGKSSSSPESQQPSGPFENPAVLSNSTPSDKPFWNEENEEKFVSLVEETTALYVITDQGYCDKVLKSQLWKEIADVLGCSEKKIRKKWESLRTQYTRFKRLTPSGRTARQTWVLTKLHFLEPHTKKTYQEENISNNVILQEGQNTIHDQLSSSPQRTWSRKRGRQNTNEKDEEIETLKQKQSQKPSGPSPSTAPLSHSTRSDIGFWTHEKEDKCVSMIEERKALYDVSKVSYSNKAVKSQLWGEIVEALGCSEKEIRKKWESLRTQYTRFKRLSPTGKTARQTWILTKLQFLEPNYKKTDSQFNLTLQEGQDTIHGKWSSSPDSPQSQQTSWTSQSTAVFTPSAVCTPSDPPYWNEEKEEKVISMIEERTALYDVSKLAYFDKVLKSQLWREIEEALGCSEKEIRKKWESLRTQYTRFKRQSVSGKTGRQTWILTKLQFLDPYIKKTDSQSNLKIQEGQDTRHAKWSSESPQSQQPSGPPQSTAALSNSNTCDTTFWNEGNEDEVITMIKERRALYDVSVLSYCDKVLKSQLWREIAETLGCSEKDVRKKWDSLRTQYTRYKKQSPAGKTGRQNWILTKLQFLETHSKNSDSPINLTIREGQDIIQSSSSPESPESQQSPGPPQSTAALSNSTPSDTVVWNEENEEKCISMIEERAALFNVKDQAYCNKVVKSQLWREIEEALGCSEKEIRTKWESLRTQYTRYKRLVPSGGGEHKITTRQTWILERLKFLDTSGTCESNQALNDSTPPVTAFWNEEKEGKLISMIQERTTLYNVMERAYCDKTVMSQLWVEIEEALGCSEKELKKKWESIRTQYTRYKRLDPSSRTGRQTWILEKMKFLEPHTRKTHSQSKIKLREGEDTIIGKPSSPQHNLSRKRGRQDITEKDEVVEALRNALQNIESRTAAPNTLVTGCGQLVSSIIKSLPPDQQRACAMQVQQSIQHYWCAPLESEPEKELQKEPDDKQKKPKRRRHEWMKPCFRERQGASYPEPEEEGLADFKNLQRVFPTQFRMLEELVTPLIRRMNTNYRDSISSGDRLKITLRFLATGEMYKTLSEHFCVGSSTIQKLVPDTCRAIYQVLKDKYMKCPDTVEEWLHVAQGFQTQWNFPNCLGALDGKHVSIKPPPYKFSANYKHSKSLEVMALVDSNYRFLYVDVGCNGRVVDSGIYGGYTLQDAMEKRTAGIPAPVPLPGTNQPAPFTMVANDAFPLQEHIMKPYPSTGLSDDRWVFNYRLSRAQRAVENAFGVLANRFCVLRTTIHLHPERVEQIVLACCVLHNFFCTECGAQYMQDLVDTEENDNFIPGKWRDEGTSLTQAVLPQFLLSDTVVAEQTRGFLSHYFTSEVGAVPFLWDQIYA